MNVKTRHIEQLRARKPEPSLLDKTLELMAQTRRAARLTISFELLTIAQHLVLTTRELDQRVAHVGPRGRWHDYGITVLEARVERCRADMQRAIREEGLSVSGQVFQSILKLAEEHLGGPAHAQRNIQ